VLLTLRFHLLAPAAATLARTALAGGRSWR